MAEDKLNVPLPRDEAPNKQILRQTISMNLLRALKLRNTVFTREVLVQQHGAVVSNVIASCRDSLMAYSALLDESDDSDPSCGDISAHY